MVKTVVKVKAKDTGAKLKSKPKAKPVEVDYDEKYKIEDALRSLTKAEEVRADKPLMDKVAAHAADQAEVANRAAMMVARGLITDKQAEKITGKATPDINKAPDEKEAAAT